MINKRRKQQLPIMPKDYFGLPLIRRGDIYYTEAGNPRYRARGQSAYKQYEHMEKKYQQTVSRKLRQIDEGSPQWQKLTGRGKKHIPKGQLKKHLDVAPEQHKLQPGYVHKIQSQIRKYIRK